LDVLKRIREKEPRLYTGK